jgi:hypothetical protein
LARRARVERKMVLKRDSIVKCERCYSLLVLSLGGVDSKRD